MNTEQIYKAWQAVGADIAGLKWEDFAKNLPEQPAQPLTVAWQVTEGGAYKSDPYWVAERVDGRGWNAHKDGENLLLADSLERCKEACELDAQKPAQPQQEPLAWMYQCSADSSGPVLMQHKRDWAESGSGLWTESPLYTSPPASKPLTDDEIKSINVRLAGNRDLPYLFARAIEAAHGIKEK